jgi:hypothetical protein
MGQGRFQEFGFSRHYREIGFGSNHAHTRETGQSAVSVSSASTTPPALRRTHGPPSSGRGIGRPFSLAALKDID